MVRFVSVLSRACVSIPGLIFFDLLLLLLNFRFLRYMDFLPWHFDGAQTHDFVAIAGPFAIRLITVGVIILERHEVLGLTGEMSHGTERDGASKKSHPFGTFFLVFGLLLECLVEQLELPTKLFQPGHVTAVVVWSSYTVALISFLAALQLLQVLVVEWWHQWQEPTRVTPTLAS